LAIAPGQANFYTQELNNMLSIFKIASLVVVASIINTTNADLPANCVGQPICAWHIRPYSDNAYSWSLGPFCNFTEPPSTLIADNIEMYDYGYDWYGFINLDGVQC
jgi:hypothetical protein